MADGHGATRVPTFDHLIIWSSPRCYRGLWHASRYARSLIEWCAVERVIKRLVEDAEMSMSQRAPVARGVLALSMRRKACTPASSYAKSTRSARRRPSSSTASALQMPCRQYTSWCD